MPESPRMPDFGPADDFTDRFRLPLERGWHVARSLIMNAGRPSADGDMWMLSDPDHMGDPAHEVDRILHQWITGELIAGLRTLQVLGEENLPNSLLLDPTMFRYLAYLDALDGSKQAFSLVGGWSINLVVQQYKGVGPDGLPECAVRFLGIVDAEGVTVTWTEPQPAVELRIVGASADTADLISDQLLVGENEHFGVTGETTVLAGGYKPKWWDSFETLRTTVGKYPAFNTAGAPVTRKALQNSDVVVVQLSRSTLWDGVGAGLIAAAGGFVCELGSTEPLPMETVIEWFSTFGYERRVDDPTRLTERYCIPSFVAGMSLERVLDIAKAARHVPIPPN